MGRIDAIISDELETKLRMEITTRFGGKKGDLVKAVDQALYSWVKRSKFERCLNKFITDCRPMGRTIDSKKFLKIIRDIRVDTIDINDLYGQPKGLTPEIVQECEEKLRNDFSELDNILTEGCNKKSLEEFKQTLDDMVKRAKISIQGL